MDAGRALDALVAEKVMGWRVDYDSYRHWTSIPYAKVEDLILTAPGDLFHGERSIASVPNYSTDIAAAWEVVEKMRARGTWLEELSGRYDEGYRAGFSWRDPDRGVLYAQAFGDTAPLAICITALRAVGVGE